MSISRVMTPEHFEALVKNFTEPNEQEIVAARWESIEGVEYFGLDINPDRPSVVFGFVELPEGMGGGLEFSTFWFMPEEGNPYSQGNSLYEQQIDIVFNGETLKFNLWHIDEIWEPIPLEELKSQRGW